MKASGNPANLATREARHPEAGLLSMRTHGKRLDALEQEAKLRSFQNAPDLGDRAIDDSARNSTRAWHPTSQ
jgi:hypothetical protein